MRFQVHIFPTAEVDLLDIRTYFEETLCTSADDLIDKFYQALLPLVNTPLIHPLVRDDVLAAKGFRSIVVDNYLIFYKITDETVQIHRFIYGRRLYTSLV